MILASLGKLSVAQDITGSDEDSTNVIQIAAVDWGAMTDLWWVVQTTTIAATAGVMKFELVLSQETTLDTNVQVCCVDIAVITDLRVATVGRYIAMLNVGKTMAMMLEADLSDYVYIGQLNTLAGSTTISINSNLSFTEPPTLKHRQIVDSNIDNSIDVASIKSGA